MKIGNKIARRKRIREELDWCNNAGKPEKRGESTEQGELKTSSSNLRQGK